MAERLIDFDGNISKPNFKEVVNSLGETLKSKILLSKARGYLTFSQPEGGYDIKAIQEELDNDESMTSNQVTIHFEAPFSIDKISGLRDEIYQGQTTKMGAFHIPLESTRAVVQFKAELDTHIRKLLEGNKAVKKYKLNPVVISEVNYQGGQDYSDFLTISAIVSLWQY